MLGGDFVYGFLLAQVHVDRAFGMKIRGYDLTKKKKKKKDFMRWWRDLKAR